MRHGGDLQEASDRYGAPPHGWLDLSTGINPRPYPVGDLNLTKPTLHSLPTSRALADLLAVAREAYDVPAACGITAAPGVEILIRSLPQLLDDPVALVDTSYASFAESWASHGRTLVDASLAMLAGDASLSAIMVNPNNPDGRLLSAREVLTLARGRAQGRMVVVDESYADAEPNASVVPFLKADDPVLVLKSFGKFFGLPGLRLGFAIGPHPLISRLAARLGDWPVSGLAISLGSRALADEGWRSETRHWLGNQAQSLDGVLRAARLESLGGCRLFRVVQAPDAAAVHARLAQHGVWTRIFEQRPGLIRFGLPADAEGLVRLAGALGAK